MFLLIFIFIFMIPATGGPQDNSAKRSLTHDDYDSWKSIVSAQISVDGRWILYLGTPQDGEANLIVKNLRTGKEYRHAIGYSGEGTDSERAARSQFSYDSTQVVFLISPSKEEVDKAKKAKEKKDKEKPKKKIGFEVKESKAAYGKKKKVRKKA